MTQGRSGEIAICNAGSQASVALALKPTIRSVAAAQDSFQQWWASSLSTLAHVEKGGQATQESKSARRT